MLNLKQGGHVRPRQTILGDQGWLTAVYQWEKFDIGLEYNLRTGIVQVEKTFHTLIDQQSF